MPTTQAFGLFAIAILAASIFYLFFYRNWRRDRELQKAFPKSWRAILSAQVPYYQRLDSEGRQRLEHQVQLFLAEKVYYGCDGFEVDDRVRVIIAGNACLLTLYRTFANYDAIRSILVYPDVYRVKHAWEQGMVVHEGEQLRAGEASSRGQVVLAWSQCAQAVENPSSPHNVMLHEFAHQLDYLDGTADGAPPLYGEQAEHWQQTMSRAYEDLRHTIEHHHKPWIDPYGATEPPEFFAVLTEAFFQQPEPLKKAQPEVYRALADYYRINPSSLVSVLRTP